MTFLSTTLIEEGRTSELSLLFCTLMLALLHLYFFIWLGTLNLSSFESQVPFYLDPQHYLKVTGNYYWCCSKEKVQPNGIFQMKEEERNAPFQDLVYFLISKKIFFKRLYAIYFTIRFYILTYTERNFLRELKSSKAKLAKSWSNLLVSRTQPRLLKINC